MSGLNSLSVGNPPQGLPLLTPYPGPNIFDIIAEEGISSGDCTTRGVVLGPREEILYKMQLPNYGVFR